MSKKEFKSGQHVNGVYEFDTTETFIRQGEKEPMQKPGQLKAGDVVRIFSQPKHIYRVTGKRKEGNKLVIQCDRVNSTDIIFHAKYKPRTGPAVLVGVEAIVKNSGMPNEHLVTIRGKKKWVPAADCIYAETPKFATVGV